jgi:hypothetical protein
MAATLDADAKMNAEIPVKSHLWETAKLERSTAALIIELARRLRAGEQKAEEVADSDAFQQFNADVRGLLGVHRSVVLAPQSETLYWDRRVQQIIEQLWQRYVAGGGEGNGTSISRVAEDGTSSGATVPLSAEGVVGAESNSPEYPSLGFSKVVRLSDVDWPLGVPVLVRRKDS